MLLFLSLLFYVCTQPRIRIGPSPFMSVAAAIGPWLLHSANTTSILIEYSGLEGNRT
jgi:hypothetical protein